MAYEFKLPDIGEGLTEGEVVKWLVAEGDVVVDDQPMVEVMTDKATVEITAPTAGTIAEIRAAEGVVVPVGSIMVVIDNGTGAAAPAAETKEEAPAAPAAPAAAPAPAAPAAPAPVAPVPVAPAAVAASAQPLRARTLAAPATRKRARELGLDLNIIPATGENGRLTRQDVETYAAAGGAAGGAATPGVPASAPAAAAAIPTRALPPISGHTPTREDQVVPLRGLRAKIAEQMVRAKQFAPHFTFAEECDMTELVALRKTSKSAAAEFGVKLTFLPYIMKALVAAFRRFPEVNSVVDDANNSYVVRGEVNIGLATDTDQGLTVVVVKNVDQLSILQIGAEIQRLTEAARSRKIAVEDLKGSTFTITSAGSIGGIMATPILNYPEVGILGVYKIIQRPMVAEGEIVIRDMANMTITLDHRIVDGATAARFMNEVVRLLQNPGLMLLEA